MELMKVKNLGNYLGFMRLKLGEDKERKRSMEVRIKFVFV